jgi:hypothetical protein
VVDIVRESEPKLKNWQVLLPPVPVPEKSISELFIVGGVDDVV